MLKSVQERFTVGSGPRDLNATADQYCLWTLRALEVYIRFEVLTAVTMKNDVFWNVTSCGSCKNRRFGGTYRHHHQGHKTLWTRNNVSSNQVTVSHLVFLRSMRRLVVMANVVPSSPILVILMMEARSSSENVGS
jgi:hypothetical protein